MTRHQKLLAKLKFMTNNFYWKLTAAQARNDAEIVKLITQQVDESQQKLVLEQRRLNEQMV